MEFLVIFCIIMIFFMVLFVIKYLNDRKNWRLKEKQDHKRINDQRDCIKNLRQIEFSPILVCENLIEEKMKNPDENEFQEIIEKKWEYHNSEIRFFIVFTDYPFVDFDIDNSFSYYLWSPNYYRNEKFQTHIFASIRDSNSGKHIFIHEFQSKVENEGLGQLLLNSFLSWARDIGVNEIEGNLVDADKDSFEKLEYLYKKVGFDVFFDHERTSGMIKLATKKWRQNGDVA